jgi:HD superfamily phosphodiesterase
MRFAAIIDTSEKALIKLLETFFKKYYNENKLPSHGLEHHRRVWQYAKELLHYIEKDYSIDGTFINKLLIACYLHDTGMSVDTGERHGRYSMDICKKFLVEQNMDEHHYQDLLSAIENHDDKEYPGSGNEDLLLTILSAADDLDAFGEMGITRYIEIYRVRGMEDNNLAKAVLENAGKRFANFERLFSHYPELIKKHRIRYKMLHDFFATQNS